MYSGSAPARTVEPLEALGIDPVVGPGGGFARSAAAQNHRTIRCRAIELEGVGGRAAVQSLFTSALEYHARVIGQRDATLEP